MTSNNKDWNDELKQSVVSCFQIRNFVTSNNLYSLPSSFSIVVICFQIRNFVTSNNHTWGKNENSLVVSCFQIRNFVTSNNLMKNTKSLILVVSCFQIRNFVTSNNLNLLKRLIFCRLLQKFKKKKPSFLFYLRNKKEGFSFSKI